MKYNKNYDKGSTEAFGFTDDFPLAQSVEFANNTSDACLFHGPIPTKWGDDFEYRHPDEYDDISAFKVMHNWVVSTYQEGATGTRLPSTYIGVDGTQYTTDTAAYRLAKFKKEFTNYFNMDFCLVYYVYTFVALMVDQRAKNMFLTTWDQVHWEPWYYDNDTVFGINNEGQLVFDYYHEDHDRVGDSNVYNGATSTLWVNFREAFPDKIKEFYQNFRSDGRLTYDKIIEYFVTRQSDKWSISIYNEDSNFKYIDMLRTDNDATNLSQIRGTGEEHLKYFIENRLMYCDSKWYATDYANDFLSLRIYTPVDENNKPREDLVVPANANITVIPFSHMYCGVRYKANGTLLQQRAEANEVVTFVAPNETFNDTETAVYGASQISSLGDLSALYCGSINISAAKKLTELIVGSGVSGYSNPNLHELSVGANTLLKKLDVRNCPNLTDPLALANCPNIQEIYATGSGITGLELPPSGYLKKVYLPATLTNLTITNQQFIEEFSLEGYDALTTLRIEKTTNVPVEDIMLNAPNLNRIRLIDVSWEAESVEALVQTINKFKSSLGLDAAGNNTDKAVVTGYVKVGSPVSDEILGDIYNNFPDLVVDDGTGTPYIINYKDRDGNVLYTLRLAEGEDAIDPIELGYIERPGNIETENYKYVFIGWSNIPTNVSKNYIVTVQYETQFAVKYYNGNTVVHTEYVAQGSTAKDPVADGTIKAPIKDGTDDLHYTFSHWDNIPINVQATTKVYAQYANVHPVRFYNETERIYVQWVIEGEDATIPEGLIPTKEGTADKHYTFDRWDNIPTNVTGICNVYALYIDTWPVRFYNDDVLFEEQWIINGQSATMPEEIPVKESTAQYNFIFSKWEGAYTNITAPTSITAVYISITRTYSVMFYNGGELIYTVHNVTYGTSTSYSGETPIKTGVDNPEEYEFRGWSPSPDNIQGETHCYALFRFMGYVKDDWTTIAENVVNGTAIEKYPVGARKEIPITLSDGIEFVADMEVIGTEHDILADDSGNKATLTFFCKDLPNLMRMMNADGKAVGWADSELRAFCNEELFASLPQELQTVIKPVYKISDGGAGNRTLVTTIDKCWLASFEEVGFPEPELYGNDYNLAGQGIMYSATFSNSNRSRVKSLYNGVDTAYQKWWLRSSYYGESSAILCYRVTNSGSAYAEMGSNLYYVAFGFCI